MNEPIIFKIKSKRRGGDSAKLWGHTRGQEVRLEIEAVLDEAPSGSVIVVNLANVEMMDASFSTAAFGRLYATISSVYPGKALVVAKPSKDVEENLHLALKDKGLMALVMRGPHKWGLIGKTSETDIPTLQALERRKQATTPVLAEDLNLNITATNQRLRKLSDSGVIVRTKIAAVGGGEQFLYEWPL